MSRCVYENKLHYNRWCSKACMYCTATQQETCWHKEVPDTNVAQTNADHIRTMTDEELADYMSEHCIEDICYLVCGGDCNAFQTFNKTSGQVCREIVLSWLKQPYKEAEDV